MNALKQKTYYSIEEYLSLSNESEEKYIYIDGEISCIGGRSLAHSVIGANMSTALNNAIARDGKECIVTSSDVRVAIDAAKTFVYPDAMVVCGEAKMSPNDEYAVTNPMLIVEVLSKSTELYDRGTKFRRYRQLPSFVEYVLINQDEPFIEVFYKENEGLWKMMPVRGLDASIYLSSLEIEVSLRDVYRGVL